MKKKLFLAGASLLLAAAAVTGYTAYSKANTSGLLTANIDALAQDETLNPGEGSSPFVECFASYNSCWFWNCWTIYRCGNPCETVKCDAASSSNTCFYF